MLGEWLGIENTITSQVTVMILLATILLSGFLVTRITKLLRLPNVSGYIIAGILIGPYVLGIIPRAMITGMGFISDIALAFIAFGVGKFLKKDVLKQTGGKVLFINLLEAFLTCLLVMLAMRVIFDLSWAFSFLLGAVSMISSPSSTLMTIKQYKAKGNFVNTLIEIIALDNLICLLAFNVASAIVQIDQNGSFEAMDLILPILFNLLVILIGFICGFILSKILTPRRSKDNRLILVIAMLLGLSALCSYLDISPLLSCMVFGTTYNNLTKDKKLYKQIDGFTPPIMSIFFILSGMKLDITVLASVGLVGICYFLIRFAGKYAGVWLGCKATKQEARLCNLLGLGLIPQGSVSIGLAVLGERIIGGEQGALFMTIILATAVMYELTGPACAKFALIKSGDISEKTLRKFAAGSAYVKEKKKKSKKKKKYKVKYPETFPQFIDVPEPNEPNEESAAEALNANENDTENIPL